MSIAPSDVDTSLFSRLRALGHNNPMSIPFADIEFKAGSTFDIDGGKIYLHDPDKMLLYISTLVWNTSQKTCKRLRLYCKGIPNDVIMTLT